MKNLLVATAISDLRPAKDGRLFYVLTAQTAGDPFARPAKRTIFQQFTAKSDPSKERNDINPQWVVGEPEMMKKIIAAKTAFPGEAVTADVEPYEVNGRTVTTYTTLLFSREVAATVFKNAQHPIKEEAVIANEVLLDEPVIN